MKKSASKKKTYPRSKTGSILMGCGGDDKPGIVIDGDKVMEYVGIGWVELRTATQKDREEYPELTDD